ncbi:PfkB family carbohydrate kinase [Bartonella sp. HY038]|uniref:PfkB family carbohydrate kinase n=1 Tax=Bartonella sp. HY038 TaxID=2759660 RepID=UPI0015F8CAA1|nr:PfkB family carbohydrate kinase [Bartonella sp. HY038]
MSILNSQWDTRKIGNAVIIGSVNIDIAGRSHQPPKPSDSNPGKISYSSGGVGRNIAHNLALLGVDISLISAVGNDVYGDNIVKTTAQIGVDMTRVMRFDGENTSTYLSVLDEHGEMVIAINDMDIVRRIDETMIASHMDAIKAANIVVVDCNLEQTSLDWLLNQKDLPTIFVDTVSAHKCTKIQNLLANINTLKPNLLEAQTLSNIAFHQPDDALKIADWFHEQGLQNLVLSAGQLGVFYSEKNGANGWLPIIKTDIVNVTGAGDAMMAGLVACKLQNMPLPKAVHFAQGCASMALMSPFTNNPDLSFKNVLNLLELSHVYDA